MNQKDFWKTLSSLKGKWKLTKKGKLLRYEDNSCPVVAVAKKKFPKAKIKKCDEQTANEFLKLNWQFVDNIVHVADYGFRFDSAYVSENPSRNKIFKRLVKLVK